MMSLWSPWRVLFKVDSSRVRVESSPKSGLETRLDGQSILLRVSLLFLLRIACSMQSFCENKSAIFFPFLRVSLLFLLLLRVSLLFLFSFKSKSAIPSSDCLLDAGLKVCRRRPPLNVLIVGDIEMLCAVLPLAQTINHTAAS